ncbi:MAG TPA: formyl transferase, partial [Planctomycetota bacterium]|nr:formyl transferase [Planctomycetota bacterium]
MAAMFLGHAFRYARRKLADLFTNEQWYPAYRFGDLTPDLKDLIEVMPPKDRYWADPFPVRTHDGRVFLFVEEFAYKDPKGRILAMEIDPVRGAGKPFPVLERDYHLSYPQVFAWQGQYWMVPESSQNGTVTLFRCVSFPDRWVEERNLLEGVQAVDATLEEVDGRWWMFVNVTGHGTGNRDELHLYHAESPLGPWLPHARNPVKSDCRGARPAGRLFRQGGQLLRPAQNCAGGYGTSIVIHRIDVLTTEAFRETPVGEIVPDWDPKAKRAHTLNRCDGFLVLDLLRRRRRF